MSDVRRSFSVSSQPGLSREVISIEEKLTAAEQKLFDAEQKWMSATEEPLKAHYFSRMESAQRVVDYYSNDLLAYDSDHQNKLPSPDAEGALDRSKHFIKALMNCKIEDVPGSDGMRVLKDIPVIDGDKSLHVIIRKKTEPFFQKVLDVCARKPGGRVCATGNPGIGKSTSIPFLIRLILQRPEPCTVVYQIRGDVDWYYQFTSTGDGMYHTEVLPQAIPPQQIPSLRDENNFLIVDSGDGTTGSCNPSRSVKACVLLITSLNGKHWGFNNFIKSHRGNGGGEFRYNFVWSWEDLKSARQFISPWLTEEEMIERYRWFGGIPRYVFADELDDIFRAQHDAVSGLTSDQAVQIIRGEIKLVDNSAKSKPSSQVLGYWSEPPFNNPTVDIISDSVRDQVAVKAANYKWSLVSFNPVFFESVVRHYLQEKRKYECKLVPPKGIASADVSTECQELGGFGTVRLVSDPVKAVKKVEDKTLFHSVDTRNPLFDMICKDGDTYHAIQATTSEAHSCILKHLGELLALLELTDKENLRLWYAVPLDKFKNFDVNPRGPNECTPSSCSVWIFGVPDPSQESKPRVER